MVPFSQPAFMALYLMTEDQLQDYVVQWLDASLPHNSVWHHSPNEGTRHISYQRRLKKLGTKWGWPDLELFIDDAGWLDNVKRLPIFIELKRPRGGKVSDNQKKIHEELRAAGSHLVVAKRIAEVELFLSRLIKLRQTGQANLVKQICEAAGG
tara:strand:- start:1052 stop:1510 length:459 start_codon:yes stop_codon:yes gene_type:complete